MNDSNLLDGVEPSPIPVIIAGATGRFGRLLQEVAAGDPAVRVVGLVSSQHPLVKCAKAGAVVIDFTTPGAAATHAGIAADVGMPMVIATTGLGLAEMAIVRAASATIPILQTPNTSIAITAVTEALRQVATMLGTRYQMAPGTRYQVAIEETHHVAKKDAPSGTALRLQQTIAEAAGIDPKTIPIQSHREGDVVGTHTVTFRGPYDTLTITHAVTDRRLFCEGALAAAKWVAAQRAGLYTMADILR